MGLQKEKTPVSGQIPGSLPYSKQSKETLYISKNNRIVNRSQEYSYSKLMSGVVAPYHEHREHIQALSDSLTRLGLHSNAHRLLNCGTELHFATPVINGKPQDKPILYSANFCSNRLCPMCAWRRSLKIFRQVHMILDYTDQHIKEYKYLLLTLTVPNVSAEDLPQKLKDMQYAWCRFTHPLDTPAVHKVMKGWARFLEVTYNKDTDTFHPHFHVVVAVNPSYFSGTTYLNHDKWLHYWQRACSDPSITQVDVRRMNCAAADGVGRGAAIAEVAKYCVKPSDLVFDDPDLMDHVVGTMFYSLKNKRLVNFGGVLADANNAIRSQGFDENDLTDVTNENINLYYVQLGVEFIKTVYIWSPTGYRRSYFILVNDFKLKPRTVHRYVSYHMRH